MERGREGGGGREEEGGRGREREGEGGKGRGRERETWVVRFKRQINKDNCKSKYKFTAHQFINSRISSIRMSQLKKWFPIIIPKCNPSTVII